MITKSLGVGLAPDVVILGDRIYVAYGQASPIPALVIVTLTLDGQEVSRRELVGDGFFNSFPRFGGPWLAYKRGAPSYGPALVQVETGEHQVFPGQAAGNFGLAVNEPLAIFAYMNGAYPIWFGEFTGGAGPSGLNGKPDGLDTLVNRSTVTLRADTHYDVAGMQYPVRAADLVVGEWSAGLGIASQLDGDVLRVALEGQTSPTPRCAEANGLYALVMAGDAVQLILASRTDLLQLPPAVKPPIPPEPIPPEPIPPKPKPPIPPIPIPPHMGYQEQLVATPQVQGIIHYVSKHASSQSGCTNYVLKDGTVFSCQPDGTAGSRPSGTDGLWEQGQESGACATFLSGQYYTWLVAPIDKLQA